MNTSAPEHLGFVTKSSAIVGNIFIPKYYEPQVKKQIDALANDYELLPVQNLVASNMLEIATGDEIGKMAYGTGPIPFVRTSDITNWEIKSDPKQGVSEVIYNTYASKHDVRDGDILFVRDGTYLIGTSCLVTEHDGPMLYQSHLLKLRLAKEAPISSPLLLAILSSPAVRRQIKAKQFTADIIDSIGHRFNELVLPVPKDKALCKKIEREVQDVLNERSRLRELLRGIPAWAQGIISSPSALPDPAAEEVENRNLGYILKYSHITSNIFMPKYYSPAIEETLDGLRVENELISLGELAEEGVLAFATGIEVGKMAYGTGTVPFIRTSDISNWELKSDPKQNVSEELYEDTRSALDVQAEDIFVVRDGTYLVGTSCILTEHDTEILYCGGLYKIRVKNKEHLDPFLLLAILNSPIVRRQMKAKQFTRDVIDTLGKRLFEIVIPIPKDKARCKEIADEVRGLITSRVSLRNRMRDIILEVAGISKLPEEDEEALDVA